MTAFTALWLLAAIVNAVEAIILSALVICLFMLARILWWDRQHERRHRHVSAHPSSHVVVFGPRPPLYDQDAEATA